MDFRGANASARLRFGGVGLGGDAERTVAAVDALLGSRWGGRRIAPRALGGPPRRTPAVLSPRGTPARNSPHSGALLCDPEEAPGTGTPVWGGISYREAHLAMEMIHDRANIVAMDLVKVNPVLDSQNVTGVFAVELAQSALGKTIL